MSKSLEDCKRLYELDPSFENLTTLYNVARRSRMSPEEIQAEKFENLDNMLKMRDSLNDCIRNYINEAGGSRTGSCKNNIDVMYNSIDRLIIEFNQDNEKTLEVEVEYWHKNHGMCEQYHSLALEDLMNYEPFQDLMNKL